MHNDDFARVATTATHPRLLHGYVLPVLLRAQFVHQYGPEMSLDIDRIATTTHSQCPEDLTLAWDVQRNAKEMLIIDSKFRSAGVVH